MLEATEADKEYWFYAPKLKDKANPALSFRLSGLHSDHLGPNDHTIGILRSLDRNARAYTLAHESLHHHGVDHPARPPAPDGKERRCPRHCADFERCFPGAPNAPCPDEIGC